MREIGPEKLPNMKTEWYGGCTIGSCPGLRFEFSRGLPELNDESLPVS
jgi:hypothetical protein